MCIKREQVHKSPLQIFCTIHDFTARGSRPAPSLLKLRSCHQFRRRTLDTAVSTSSLHGFGLSLPTMCEVGMDGAASASRDERPPQDLALCLRANLVLICAFPLGFAGYPYIAPKVFELPLSELHVVESSFLLCAFLMIISADRQPEVSQHITSILPAYFKVIRYFENAAIPACSNALPYPVLPCCASTSLIHVVPFSQALITRNAGTSDNLSHDLGALHLAKPRQISGAQRPD